jgi:excisionase family DNA binding protein
MTNDEILSTEDAAEYIGISTKSFYNTIYRGEISPINPNEKPYLFSKADLNSYLTNRHRRKLLRKNKFTAPKISTYKVIRIG